MRILLFGATGQVGRELGRSLLPLGELIVPKRGHADFTDPASLAAVVNAIKPDIIVNAAAYTAVDGAEAEPAKANLINALALKHLADAAKASKALLVHYSTDYVFDGTAASPYREEDHPDPINAYGKSKLAGEEYIRESGCDHLILRTSWVYALHGRNFAKTILNAALKQEYLQVVDDQTGSPTSAELIADITALCLYRMMQERSLTDHKDGARSWGSLCGTYHLTAAGSTTWYDFAGYLTQGALSRGIALKTRPENIRPVTSASFNSAAARPANSLLDCAKLRRNFAVTLPDWSIHADRFLDGYKVYNADKENI